MQRKLLLLVFCLVSSLLLASCAKPPQTAYENDSGTGSSTGAGLSVGQNTAGEACNSQAVTGGADVYCGSWDQPSAHVQTGGPAGGASLVTLATSSPWRASLEGAYACAAPTPGAILDGVPAEIDPAAVEAYLTELPGVTGIHHLHIWATSTTETALTVHLVRPGSTLDDALLAEASHQLRRRFAIDHATFQLERGETPCALVPATV